MVDSIKGLGGLLPLQGGQDPKEKEKAKKDSVSPRADSVSISSEAKARQKASKGPVSVLAQKLKMEGPLVRDDKVSQAEQRLQSGYYGDKLSDVAAGILKDILT